jgi:hypothetical protein
MAVSDAPLGTVPGIQFAAVFQSLLVGITFHVALPAQVVCVLSSRREAGRIPAMNVIANWRSAFASLASAAKSLKKETTQAAMEPRRESDRGIGLCIDLLLIPKSIEEYMYDTLSIPGVLLWVSSFRIGERALPGKRPFPASIWAEISELRAGSSIGEKLVF